MTTRQTAKQSKAKGAKHKPKRPRRANGVATRERIIETANAMFAASGYQATSLRQIAGAVDIDIATLKYHFGDKPSLFAEVYRLGHEEFLRYLNPCIESLNQAQNTDALRVALEDLVIALHDFLDENFTFVRMILFRLLEGSEDIISLEEELQDLATEIFDDTFQTLKQRKLLRDVDHRAVITLLISAFTTWFVIAEVKPQWLQKPSPFTTQGRRRSENFFVDLLERLLLD